jgi:hypothetical protein
MNAALRSGTSGNMRMKYLGAFRNSISIRFLAHFIDVERLFKEAV